MNKEDFTELINFAKKCVEGEKEYQKEAFLAILTGLIIKGDFSTATQSQGGRKPVSESMKNLSVKEFLLSKNPKSHAERTACFAFFEEQHNNKKSWTTKDIAGNFRSAKEPLPKNLSDTIYQLRAKGWVMESGKGYTLTNTGEKKVREGFSREDKK